MRRTFRAVGGLLLAATIGLVVWMSADRVSDRAAVPAPGIAVRKSPSQVVSAPPENDAGRDDVSIGEGVRVVGVVKSGGEPVPSVRIHARVDNVHRGTVSEIDGTFSIAFPRRGRLVIEVPGYEVRSAHSFNLDKAIEEIQIDIMAGGSVGGRVLFAGRPVPGAEVVLEVPSQRVVADSEGRYRIDHLPHGTLRIQATLAARDAESRVVDVMLAPGESRTDLDLELDRGSSIAGTVVDEYGTPMPGVHVMWTCAPCAGWGQAVSDTDGHFRVTHLPGGGTYAATVRSRHADGAVGSGEEPRIGAEHKEGLGRPFPVIRIADGATHVDEVRLVVGGRTGTLRGRVVDDEGRGVRGILVVVMPRVAEARTDETGRFSIDGLPQGTYSIAIGERGQLAQLGAVETGDSDILIRVPATVIVHGRLDGFRPGAVLVAVSRQEPNDPFEWREVVDGHSFAIPVPPGERWFIATQGAAVALERVRVAPPADPQPVLRVRPAASVTGRTRSAEMIDDVTCEWSMDIPALGRSRMGRIWTDESGRFAFDGPTGVPLYVSCRASGRGGRQLQGELSIDAFGVSGVTGLEIDISEQ